MGERRVDRKGVEPSAPKSMRKWASFGGVCKKEKLLTPERPQGLMYRRVTADPCGVTVE